MELEDSRWEKEGLSDPETTYEPPKAIFVRFTVEERLEICRSNPGQCACRPRVYW
jgi:hypothetical protein